MSEVKEWMHLESNLHADCKIYKVYRDHCIHPAKQKKGDFFIADHRNWVQVLALTENQDLILVKQYRFGSKSITLELPAGVAEVGEDPVATAVRELIEETGYAGESPTLIGSCEPNPALQNNTSYFVLIKNCKLVAQTNWDDNEELETLILSKDEVLEKVRNQEITNSMTMSAIFFWKEWHQS